MPDIEHEPPALATTIGDVANTQTHAELVERLQALSLTERIILVALLKRLKASQD